MKYGQSARNCTCTHAAKDPNMKIGDAFPSRYMKAHEDVPEDGHRIFTIADVRMEKIGRGADAEDKLIVTFHESDKEFVLNKTNATTISGLYGGETDDWAEKRITLYCTFVEFQGKMVPGLRVRPKIPPASKGGTKPAAKVPVAPVTEGEIDPDDPNAPPF
jgi:hypothetical protein